MVQLQESPNLPLDLSSHLHKKQFLHYLHNCNQVQLVASLAQFKEQLQAASAAAIILSLSYDELQQPAELESLLSDTAAGLPILALVNSVNAELHADIGRRIGGVCLPKSLGESALDRQLLRLITGVDTRADAQEPGSLQSLQGLSILVADDNRINRLLERILLEKHGARVLEAKSGQELLKLVTEHAVDLILLDMHMPDQDGWQVAQRLRSELRLAIPVIALSAAQSDKSAQALAEAGLSGWLMKPLDEAALTAIIGRLLPASRLSAVALITAPSAAPEEALAGLRPALRQMLAEDLPAQWQAVEQAWQQHDLGQLQEQVHKLNGTAAFCRLLNLRSLCAQLETLLRDPRDSALAP